MDTLRCHTPDRSRHRHEILDRQLPAHGQSVVQSPAGNQSPPEHGRSGLCTRRTFSDPQSNIIFMPSHHRLTGTINAVQYAYTLYLRRTLHTLGGIMARLVPLSSARLVLIGRRRCYPARRMARLANMSVLMYGKKTLVEVHLRESYSAASQTKVSCYLVCDLTRLHDVLLALGRKHTGTNDKLPGYAGTSGYVNILGLFNARGELVGFCDIGRRYPVIFRSNDIIKPEDEA